MIVIEKESSIRNAEAILKRGKELVEAKRERESQTVPDKQPRWQWLRECIGWVVMWIPWLLVLIFLGPKNLWHTYTHRKRRK